MTTTHIPECYVCGDGPHEDRVSHNFWSIEEAREFFARQPQGSVPEGAYVDEHRPR